MSKERIEPDLIKDVKSDTKTSGKHIKVGKDHYVVLKYQMGNLGWYIIAQKATRTGRPDLTSAPIMRYRGDDLDAGVKEFIEILNGKEARVEKIPFGNLR